MYITTEAHRLDDGYVVDSSIFLLPSVNELVVSFGDNKPTRRYDEMIIIISIVLT